MTGCCSFILRVAFLAFFALNAWNTLKNVDSHSVELRNSYQRFERSFTERTGIKFPDCITTTNLEKNSNLITKSLAFAQLGLVGAALFICSSFTALAGFIYFFISLIQLNVAKMDFKTKLTELEPLALALGLFAASLALSCSGCKTDKKDCRARFSNLNESATSKASSEQRPKKKTQRD